MSSIADQYNDEEDEESTDEPTAKSTRLDEHSDSFTRKRKIDHSTDNDDDDDEDGDNNEDADASSLPNDDNKSTFLDTNEQNKVFKRSSDPPIM